MLTLLACFLRKCYCSAGNDLDINRGDVVRQIWKTSALFQFAGIFVFLEFLGYLFVDFFLPDLGLDNSGRGEFFKFRNSVEGTGAERLAGDGTVIEDYLQLEHRLELVTPFNSYSDKKNQ